MITKGEWQIGKHGNNRFEVLSDRRIAVVDTQDDARLIAVAPGMYSFLVDLARAIVEGQERIGASRGMILSTILAKVEGKCQS